MSDAWTATGRPFAYTAWSGPSPAGVGSRQVAEADSPESVASAATGGLSWANNR
jgi:hypothetical protein